MSDMDIDTVVNCLPASARFSLSPGRHPWSRSILLNFPTSIERVMSGARSCHLVGPSLLPEVASGSNCYPAYNRKLQKATRNAFILQYPHMIFYAGKSRRDESMSITPSPMKLTQRREQELI
jgi:hypothetical protein